MRRINIDVFGGIVTNADNEDIGQRQSVRNINFSISKSGTLRPQELFKTVNTISDKNIDTIHFATDPLNNDQRYVIVILDDGTVEIWNNTFTAPQYRGFSSSNSSLFYSFTANTVDSSPMSPLVSTGTETVITPGKTDWPIRVQYIKDRKFFGYHTAVNNWYRNNLNDVISFLDDGFFVDRADARLNYAKDRRYKNGSVLDQNFSPTINSINVSKNYLVTKTVAGAVTVAVSEQNYFGNISLTADTSKGSRHQLSYDFALVYDGNNISPMSNNQVITEIPSVDQYQKVAKNKGYSVKLEVDLDYQTYVSSAVNEISWNPRITGLAVYRNISNLNYLNTSSNLSKRAIGFFKLDRDSNSMNRVAISSSDILLLGYDKAVTLDMQRQSSIVTNAGNYGGQGDGSARMHITQSFSPSGVAEIQVSQIANFVDETGVIQFESQTGSEIIMDGIHSWELRRSADPSNNLANSGSRLIGGESWIIIPGLATDGDGYYDRCIITEQSIAEGHKKDCIVESFLYSRKDDSNVVRYYHACRLVGDSLWLHLKTTGLIDVWIYRTNEPIHFDRINKNDGTNDKDFIRCSVYDTRSQSFDAHPFGDSKTNNTYNVVHRFNGRQWVGDVTIDKEGEEESFSNLILFSELSQYSVIPSKNFIRITDSNGGKIVGFSDLGNSLYIFLENSIYTLNLSSGNQSNWVLKKVSSEIGCLATGSILKLKDRIFFAGIESIYYITSVDQIVPVSLPINDKYFDYTLDEKKKIKCIYDQKEAKIYFHTGKSSRSLLELHTNSQSPTWTERNLSDTNDGITKNFDNKLTIISNANRLDNPIAR